MKPQGAEINNENETTGLDSDLKNRREGDENGGRFSKNTRGIL